jgi:hypothetical protein
MKNDKSHYLLTLGLLMVFVVFGILFINGCTPSKEVAAKTGVQLWGENCQRCHNTPSPSTFSPEQWETVGMHMQTRALITENEKNKIVEFLKTTH